MAEPGHYNLLNAAEPESEDVSAFTVKFEEDLEEEFQESIEGALLKSHRSGLVVLALVCAGYALLDWLIMPELRYLVWSIRFLGILPFAMIAIILTYWKPMQEYSTFLSVGGLIISSAGTIAMMVFAPPAVSGAYFAGLLIHIMLCFGIFRLEFITSMFCGLVMLVSYNVGAVLFGSFTTDTLLMHNFVFITGTVLGGVQSYTRNQMVRELFLKERHREEVLAPDPVEAQQELWKATVFKEPAQPQSKEEPLAAAPAPAIFEEEVFKSIELEVLSKKSEEANAAVRSAEREQALEQELKGAGQLFNLFMERISDVVWFTDPEGRFLYVSPSSERVWGHSAKDLLKKNFRELLTRDSYEYFNAEVKAANRMSGGSLRPIDLEIVTKNRVVKTGETVALAFQDHDTYGSGIIGVTRDMTYRRKTELELKKFNEELESLIKKRSGELEDTLKRLRSMEEAMKVTEAPERLEEPPAIRYLRGNLDALHRQLLQLKEATHQLKGIYSIKSMRKEDLENYLQSVEALSNQIDIGLRDSLDHLYSKTPEPQKSLRPESKRAFRFRLGDYIEQVLIRFGSRFKKARHMVDIDCPDSIEVVGDPELYSQMLNALVSYSLDIGLAGVTGGGIEIQVSERDENLVLMYKDNGKGLTAEALDQLFEKPYQDSADGTSLQRARDIVRDELEGEFRLNSQDGSLVFEIAIPKERNTTA